MPPGDPALFTPVTSAVPAVVFTGQLDQITPPRYGVVTARQLSASTLIAVPGVGHSPALAIGACGVGIISRFFDDPARPPDVSCVRRVTGRPPPA